MALGIVEIPAEARFDAAAIERLAAVVGEAACCGIVASFIAHITTCVAHPWPALADGTLTANAHATINAEGLLGFGRLVEICRSAELPAPAIVTYDALLAELVTERDFVLERLARYQDVVCRPREASR